MSETLFTATDRELVELHVRSSRGKVIEAVHALLVAYDARCGECEAARNVIEQLLDPQVDEAHAFHGHYEGNQWIRDSDHDCPLCEWEDIRV